MIQHNIEEYEWLEQTFDNWVLHHKQREVAIARTWHFNGWHVQLADQHPLPMVVDSLEAAKTIAMINATTDFESFKNAYLFPRRAPKPTSESIYKRVSKMDRVRR